MIYFQPRQKNGQSPDLFEYPESRTDKEEVVRFLHARLPCVPIKVIRANSFEPEARVFTMRTNDEHRQLIGAVVFKDHEQVEFREVKYFCTAYQGGGIGTRLMNALKTDSVDFKFFYIVLYASNTAVDFFSKQKFLTFPEQVIGLSKSVVLARVEQYQRSTLMACDLIDLFPGSFSHMADGLILREGDTVLVSHGIRHARDEEGEIIEKKGNLKIKVHYPKWTVDSDEWIVVGSKRLKFLPPPDDSDDDSRTKKANNEDDDSLFSRIKRIRIL
jgi:hypothetical protein